MARLLMEKTFTFFNVLANAVNKAVFSVYLPLNIECSIELIHRSIKRSHLSIQSALELLVFMQWQLVSIKIKDVIIF